MLKDIIDDVKGCRERLDCIMLKTLYHIIPWLLLCLRHSFTSLGIY